ncbi:MAG: adenylate/guanylate cyclase domain-containing protein [Actinomycetota bacterium]
MDPPETRYTSVGDSQVAYQVFGDGPDVVFSFGFLNHIDYRWDDPGFSRFMRRMASFARVVIFDRRGTGASDPLPEAAGPSWEGWVDDLDAVLEVTGSERAAIVGVADAGAMAVLFAATYPDRVASLILTITAAAARSVPGYAFGIPAEKEELFLSLIEESWGKEDGRLVSLMVPDRADDPEFVRWYAKLQRASSTPRRAVESARWIFDIDVRHALPMIRVPTLVVGLSEDAFVPVDASRYLAEHIEDAKLLLLKGRNSGASWLNESDRYLAAIEEHVTGKHHPVEPDRVLATVLLTDIVGSTELASRHGDRRWRELLDRHDRLAGRHVDRFGGRLVKSMGDGVLATFDGPARAVRAAAELSDELQRFRHRDPERAACRRGGAPRRGHRRDRRAHRRASD